MTAVQTRAYEPVQGISSTSSSKPKRKVRKVADLFCGAGGSSTGAKRALERLGFEMELVCVNHWDMAIDTHSRNHPDARHYCMDIEAAKPEDLVPEGYLDLLMASPSCIHHSRARGGKPTTDQQRMDPWHVVRWCTALRVRRLIIENVPEFVEWGPVDPKTGRPVKSRKGEYFRAWVAALEAIGMIIDWRILNAADYGDVTTRKRFFLLARADRKAIRWPQPTHAPADKARMLGLEPWKAAREIIDWDIEGTSIFDRPRPLADNTFKRIYAGLKKFGGPMAEAFLVVLRQHCDALDIDGPLPTITAGGNHIGLAEPRLTPFVLGQHGGSVARAVDDPIPTIATAGAISLIEPSIIHMKGRSDARHIDRPLPTVTTKSQIGVMEPFMIEVNHSGKRRTRTVDEPLPTVTGKRGAAVIEPFIVPQFGEREGQKPRTHAIDAPLPTVTSHGAGAVVMPDFKACDTLDADETTTDRIVTIDGKPYLLDIRFRMLANHELARAMGFSDEEGEYEFAGNKTQVTKQIGNAVPVRTASALVSEMMSY